MSGAYHVSKFLVQEYYSVDAHQYGYFLFIVVGKVSFILINKTFSKINLTILFLLTCKFNILFKAVENWQCLFILI